MQRMSEKDAIELIDKLRDLANDTEVDMFCVASLNAYFEESANAIQTLLEEIQQYRAIGTVEEIEKALQQLAQTKYELKKFYEIGTHEQCHDAVERMKPKKAHKYVAFDGIERNGCPRCYEERGRNEILYAGQKYCSVCSQALDWSE